MTESGGAAVQAFSKTDAGGRKVTYLAFPVWLLSLGINYTAELGRFPEICFEYATSLQT